MRPPFSVVLDLDRTLAYFQRQRKEGSALVSSSSFPQPDNGTATVPPAAEDCRVIPAAGQFVPRPDAFAFLEALTVLPTTSSIPTLGTSPTPTTVSQHRLQLFLFTANTKTHLDRALEECLDPEGTYFPKESREYCCFHREHTLSTPRNIPITYDDNNRYSNEKSIRDSTGSSSSDGGTVLAKPLQKVFSTYGIPHIGTTIPDTFHPAVGAGASPFAPHPFAKGPMPFLLNSVLVDDRLESFQHTEPWNGILVPPWRGPGRWGCTGMPTGGSEWDGVTDLVGPTLDAIADVVREYYRLPDEVFVGAMDGTGTCTQMEGPHAPFLTTAGDVPAMSLTADPTTCTPPGTTTTMADSGKEVVREYIHFVQDRLGRHNDSVLEAVRDSASSEESLW